MWKSDPKYDYVYQIPFFDKMWYMQLSLQRSFNTKKYQICLNDVLSYFYVK